MLYDTFIFYIKQKIYQENPWINDRASIKYFLADLRASLSESIWLFPKSSFKSGILTTLNCEGAATRAQTSNLGQSNFKFLEFFFTPILSLNFDYGIWS